MQKFWNFFFLYKLFNYFCNKMRQRNSVIDNINPQELLSKNDELNLRKKTKFSKSSDKSSFLGRKHKIDRSENSLEEIAKKFFKCISKIKGNSISINDVVKELNVKKRRIYDVTNVLEGNYIFILIVFLLKNIGIGYIKKEGRNKIEWLKGDLILKNIVNNLENNENNEKINIKDNKEKKINLIQAEIKKVEKLIAKEEDNLNKMNKNIFLTYDDIKGGDKYHNYIALKSNGETNPDIIILNEDDLEDNKLDINHIKENIFINNNKNINLNNNIINKNQNIDINQLPNKKSIENNERINNINNSLNIKSFQNEKPFDFCINSSNNQDSLENNINNSFFINNDYKNNNNVEFHYNKYKRKDSNDSELSFINNFSL